MLCTAAAVIGTATAPPASAFSTLGSSSNCQPAAGLSLAIGEPPQPGSVDANGDLILYCRTPATNSRDGAYTQGANTDGTVNYVGACSVDIPYEQAQVLSETFRESSSLSQVGLVDVSPIAFWTGTIGATIVARPDYFLYGSVIGDASNSEDVLGADWASASAYGPAPPGARLGSGLADGGMITAGLANEIVSVQISTDLPGSWYTTASGAHLCQGPELIATFTLQQDSSNPPSETSEVVPTWAPPTEQEALDSLGAAAGQVQTSAPDDYVVFAPTCFWVSPQPVSPPFDAKVENVLGPPDSNGESIVYSYYLDVAPSSTVHWSFGDGTGEDMPASGSGPGSCVSHYYKQVSGEGNVPAVGATVSASQDVVVTAFVGWVDAEGSAHYRCVTTDGGLADTDQGTEAAAVTSCSTTYADALMDTPLPPKPVYQVRAIPVA
ncbi:MAG: hypothetical protein ACLQT7_00025 [Candidatus Dormibacteria bacterium]